MKLALPGVAEVAQIGCGELSSLPGEPLLPSSANFAEVPLASRKRDDQVDEAAGTR